MVVVSPETQFFIDTFFNGDVAAYGEFSFFFPYIIIAAPIILFAIVYFVFGVVNKEGGVLDKLEENSKGYGVNYFDLMDDWDEE